MQPGTRTLCISPIRTERPDRWKLGGEILIQAHVKQRIGLFSQFEVGDLPVLAVSRPLRLGYATVLIKGNSYLQPGGTSYKWPVWIDGSHFYLCPLRRLQPGKRTLYISPIRHEKSDYWKLDGEILTRVHVKQRRRLFSPTGVRDLPVGLEQLSPARQTYYTYTTGQTGHLDDTWVLPSTASRALEFEWAGETHFHIEDMAVLPTRVLKRTHSQTQSDKPHYPPGLQPAAVSIGAQASEDTQMDLSLSLIHI